MARGVTVAMLIDLIGAIARFVRALVDVFSPTPTPPGPASGFDHLTPEVLDDLRGLAARWATSFCGKCKASPDHPQGRCPECLERLGKMLEELKTDGQRKGGPRC